MRYSQFNGKNNDNAGIWVGLALFLFFGMGHSFSEINGFLSTAFLLLTVFSGVFFIATLIFMFVRRAAKKQKRFPVKQKQMHESKKICTPQNIRYSKEYIERAAEEAIIANEQQRKWDEMIKRQEAERVENQKINLFIKELKGDLNISKIQSKSKPNLKPRFQK